MTPNITPDEMTKPRREEHTVRLSSYESDNARRLAAKQERAFADVLSEAVRIGLDVLIERDTRVNVWTKTNLKAELASLLAQLPEDALAQAIHTLKQDPKEQ